MDYKCSDEQHAVCVNTAFCKNCNGMSLFKKPKWLIRKEKEAARRLLG